MRRLRLGMSVRELAGRSGDDRGRLAKLEAGDLAGSPDDDRRSRGHSGPPLVGASAEVIGEGVVAFRISNALGTSVVVRGQVEDLPLLEIAVGRLVEMMQSEPTSE